MSRKIYRSAMGKPVDLGALFLQNEQTRAVGNMNVNARGDVLDSANRVIEPKNRQAQRQYKRQTNVSGRPIVTKQEDAMAGVVDQTDTFEDLVDDEPEEMLSPVITAPEVAQESDPPRGGLAAAIARTREVKQELEKTRRQQQQSQGVRRI
jgi:hypothetical protein